MEKTNKLYLLWTSGEKITFHEMIFLYALNGMKHHWWDQITIVIWGASAQLVATDQEVRNKLKSLFDAGVQISACKGCADNLKVTDVLEKLGVEVKYWGVPLTELLHADEKILTI